MHWDTTKSFAVCSDRDRKHMNSFVGWDSCAFEMKKRRNWILGIALRIFTKSKRAGPNRLRWVGIGGLGGLGWKVMRDEERWQIHGRLYIMGRIGNFFWTAWSLLPSQWKRALWINPGRGRTMTESEMKMLRCGCWRFRCFSGDG